MKILSYLSDGKQLDHAVDEWIIEPQVLSRFGRLTIDQTNSLARSCQGPCFLEWDVLMTEDCFRVKVEELKKIDLDLFQGVRVQDPGAFHYVKQKTKLPLHLILETGHHNLASLEQWCDLAGERLQRVSLSLELTAEKLKCFIPFLHARQVEVEFLGLGRILLFYTPRKLLTPLKRYAPSEQKKRLLENEEVIEALASSEESAHKNFPVLENEHGTFMFHLKNHGLLSQHSILTELGLDCLRLDLRFGDEAFLEYAANWTELLKHYPHALTHSFFRSNKTDVLFPKLKNKNLQNRQGNFQGKVIDVIKERFLVLENQKGKLTQGEWLCLKSPLGKKKDVELKKIFNSNLEERKVLEDKVILIPYEKGFPAGSLFFTTEVL